MSAITEKIFGLQIKRAAELIGEQGRDAFWLTGIALDARLISIATALYENGECTSTDLADITGFSRQLVESRLKKLQNEGYVISILSSEDGRKRLFSIAPKRKQEVAEAVAMIVHFEKVYTKLWKEIGVDLSDGMLKLEKALRTRPLLARICDAFPEYESKIDLKGAGDAA